MVRNSRLLVPKCLLFTRKILIILYPSPPNWC
jgi:hypothetical protein